ncbi:hypothetical protein ACK1O1_19040 [Stenotrophomonas maltophilia]
MADASWLRSLWVEIAAKHNVCIHPAGVNHLDAADGDVLIDHWALC